MNNKANTNEPFFTTLGRLKTAITQTTYGPEYIDRALELYEQVSDTINVLAGQDPHLFRILTGIENPEATTEELVTDSIRADIDSDQLAEAEEAHA